MGEAKRRGDFEERKSQAIKAGRVKSKAKGEGSPFLFGDPFLALTLLRPRKRRVFT